MLSISQRALELPDRQAPSGHPVALAAGFSFPSPSFENMREPTIQSG
jgi:hypothetical protein